MSYNTKDLHKQVHKTHYDFCRYMSKERWCSVWHQVDEVQKLHPASVLEVGPGPGIFKAVAATFGVVVETIDVDSDLKPDHIGTALDLPFSGGSYDVVCAFQMLEHIPYEMALLAFDEMVRVANRYVVISLPDSRQVWRYCLHVPKVGMKNFSFRKPRLRAPKHKFDGEHYWELNKRGYELSKVVADLARHGSLLKTYRVRENPYHRFFVFQK